MRTSHALNGQFKIGKIYLLSAGIVDRAGENIDPGSIKNIGNYGVTAELMTG